MSPALLTVAAVTAACVAAAIGWRYTPARRDARKARREQVRALCRQQDITARVHAHVASQIAIHTEESVWLDLLAEHPELHTRTSRKRGA